MVALCSSLAVGANFCKSYGCVHHWQRVLISERVKEYACQSVSGLCSHDLFQQIDIALEVNG
jgi:hypothetical protein